MTDLLPALLAAAPSAELAEQLRQKAYQARGTMAPETGRALRRAGAAFQVWAAAQGHPTLPAATELVADYVDALAASGRKVAGIRQSVWAIGTMHRLLALPDPTREDVVRFALKRMARQLGTRPRQAAPLGEDDVRLLLRTAGTTLLEQRDLALLLVMRDLLARRSEVVALDLADLHFEVDGSATALIRRSKTDQAGEGATRWLAPRTVASLRCWLYAAGLRDGAVFRAVNKAGRPGGRLGAAEVPRLLKQLAASAGLDPATVSGHSPRVGMAQDLVASGADLASVMQAGRWKSPTMPARYAERLTARRGAVARFYERQR